ncbi:MAG: hypothetical protein V4653_03050 [Pseudomonadota bacterium]
MIKGVVEKIGVAGASGWLQLPRARYRPDSPPLVQVFVSGKLLATGPADLPRRDVTTDDCVGLGFSLSSREASDPPRGLEDVQAFATVDGTTVVLAFERSLRLSLELGSLNEHQLKAVARHLSAEQTRKLVAGLVPAPAADGGRNQRATLCVVTYAHDATAWFPYFYNYYRDLVGPHGIYVVTPTPENFAGYALGGLITAARLEFDDAARAYLMSHLATGLHAYYRWSLVCDVDEFVVPHPLSGLSFLDMLATGRNPIAISRGLDMIQAEGEPDFDMSAPILEQRRYGVPNTAMCKPHLARVPVSYSGGFHYCQERMDFAARADGFLTLHMKWACNRMRREVAEAVQKTVFSNRETADYSLRSVTVEPRHPMAAPAFLSRASPLESDAMEGFEALYRSNLTYDAPRGLWVGKHVVAPFVVDLREQAAARGADDR